MAGSPSINRGDPNFVPVPGETDLDGHARVLCSAVDMGPYEFGIGDVDCDESVDLNDYAALTLCLQGPDTAPGDPDCIPFDFDADADVDLADVAGFQRVFTPPAP
ncbi:MAG: choice-of-anchor Q domain-containing protein [Phycisphaerae bacterium]